MGPVSCTKCANRIPSGYTYECKAFPISLERDSVTGEPIRKTQKDSDYKNCYDVNPNGNCSYFKKCNIIGYLTRLIG